MKNTILILGSKGGIGTGVVNILREEFNLILPNSKELDVSSDLSITNYFQNLEVKQIHGIIYCVGINNTEVFDKLEVDDFEKALNVNVIGLIKIIKNLDKKFINHETRICAISSLYGSISRFKRSPYSTSKHALNGLIKSLALEYANRGILINSVSPGFIETELTFKNNSKNKIEELTRNIPLGRLGKPKEVANLVKFLIQESNTYITGQNFIIDGGYMAGGFQKD